MTKTVHDITDNNIKLSLLSMKINGIETIITKILTQLQSILTAHYKLHKLNDMLTLVQQLFCINNTISKIHNRKPQILSL